MRQVQEKEFHSSVFVQVIEDTIEQLEKQKIFIEQSFSQPEFLFKDAGCILGSYKNHIFHIMNRWDEGKKTLKVHDFQSFLASVLNEFVQQWAKEQSIQEALSVKVRKPNYFPSIYAVYHGDIELIQFDILQKYYGIRDEVKNEQQIKEEYAKRESERQEVIERHKSAIADYEEIKASPFTFVWKHYRKQEAQNRLRKLMNELRDYAFILFRRKKLNRLLDEAIERHRDSIFMLENRAQKVDKVDVDEVIRKERIRATLIEKVKPMFEQYGYRLETERYKLY